jgi:drug/metabolite transporter (DMT)-like permease
MKMGLFASDKSVVFSPIQVASLRMGIAALVLSPLAIRGLRHVGRGDWKYLSIVGLCGSGIPAFCFATAQQHMDSGLAGILNGLTPIFTLIVGAFLFRKRPNGFQVAGILTGFIGAIFIVSNNGASAENPLYPSLIILATFLYGISVNTVSSKLQHLPSPSITSISIAIAGIPSLFIFFLATPVSQPFMHPEIGRSLMAITTLSVLGTGLANILFFKVAQKSGALLASFVTYLIPLVAVGWGQFLLHENLLYNHILGGFIILVGVYIGNRKKK